MRRIATALPTLRDLLPIVYLADLASTFVGLVTGTGWLFWGGLVVFVVTLWILRRAKSNERERET